MDKKERLVTQIMKECEKEGEPVTREEAAEMAEMEIKSNSIKRYEKSEKKRKPSSRERKTDEDKKYLFNLLIDIINSQAPITSIKTESEFSFEYKDNSYSVKLIKHRKSK